MNRRQIRALVVLALVAATLTLFSLTERYQVRQPQVLSNGDFSQGFDGWRTNGQGAQLRLDQGVLRIEATEPGHSPGVRQTIMRDPEAKRVRLSAWVRHAGIATGLRIWNGMRILLVQKDASGTSLWELPHVVEQERGSGPWRQVSQVFWLPPRVTAMEVVAVLSQVAGQMQVRGLTLEVVQERAAFGLARYGLIAVWLAALPWLAWPLYRPGPMRRGRLIVSLLGIVILAGALTPHSAKNELRRFVYQLLPSDRVASVETTPTQAKPTAPATAAAATTGRGFAVPIGELWYGAHKLGHFVLFALLALTVRVIWRRQSWRRLAFYLAVFAVAAETLQLLSVDRSANIPDAGLNLSGIAAGLALGCYLAQRRSALSKVPDPPSV